jgi:hypothetical protein
MSSIFVGTNYINLQNINLKYFSIGHFKYHVVCSEFMPDYYGLVRWGECNKQHIFFIWRCRNLSPRSHRLHPVTHSRRYVIVRSRSNDPKNKHILFLRKETKINKFEIYTIGSQSVRSQSPDYVNA